MQLSVAKRLSSESIIMRPVFREELRRIRNYEKEIINKYDFSVVVSQTDREFLNSEKVVDIPVGIDTNVFFRKINCRITRQSFSLETWGIALTKPP